MQLKAVVTTKTSKGQQSAKSWPATQNVPKYTTGILHIAFLEHATAQCDQLITADAIHHYRHFLSGELLELCGEYQKTRNLSAITMCLDCLQVSNFRMTNFQMEYA